MTYPPNWPKCPACGKPALDGHITCGSVECDEHGHRRARDAARRQRLEDAQHQYEPSLGRIGENE